MRPMTVLGNSSRRPSLLSGHRLAGGDSIADVANRFLAHLWCSKVLGGDRARLRLGLGELPPGSLGDRELSLTAEVTTSDLFNWLEWQGRRLVSTRGAR